MAFTKIEFVEKVRELWLSTTDDEPLDLDKVLKTTIDFLGHFTSLDDSEYDQVFVAGMLKYLLNRQLKALSHSDEVREFLLVKPLSEAEIIPFEPGDLFRWCFCLNCRCPIPTKQLFSRKCCCGYRNMQYGSSLYAAQLNHKALVRRVNREAVLGAMK